MEKGKSKRTPPKAGFVHQLSGVYFFYYIEKLDKIFSAFLNVTRHFPGRLPCSLIHQRLLNRFRSHPAGLGATIHETLEIFTAMLTCKINPFNRLHHLCCIYIEPLPFPDTGITSFRIRKLAPVKDFMLPVILFPDPFVHFLHTAQ